MKQKSRIIERRLNVFSMPSKVQNFELRNANILNMCKMLTKDRSIAKEMLLNLMKSHGKHCKAHLKIAHNIYAVGCMVVLLISV